MDFADFGYIKVAAASPEVAIANPMANATAILATAQVMAAQGVSIAVFPELCVTGYSAEDLFFTEALLRDSEQALVQLVADNPLPLITVGIPWRLADA